MTKRQSAKYKIDRRYGVNLWGRAKSPVQKKNYAPGQHGQKQPKKPTEYGLQLTARQMLKGYYGGIGERQFRRIYSIALSKRGDTSHNLLVLLERRLDSVVYRMKFATTIFGAGQLVSHGHIRVNGRKITVRSCLIDDKDVVELSEKAKSLKIVQEAFVAQDRSVPAYFDMDSDVLRGTFRIPSVEEIPYAVTMNPRRVVEFYSK